jgi:hypothetical protein
MTRVLDYHHLNPKYRYQHITKFECDKHGIIKESEKTVVVGRVRYCAECYNDFLQGKVEKIKPVVDKSERIDTWKR